MEPEQINSTPESVSTGSYKINSRKHILFTFIIFSFSVLYVFLNIYTIYNIKEDFVPYYDSKTKCYRHDIDLCSKVVDETYPWITYYNNEYGFEFKYPTGWILDSKNPAVCISGSPCSVFSVTQASYEDNAFIDIKYNSGGCQADVYDWGVHSDNEKYVDKSFCTNGIYIKLGVDVGEKQQEYIDQLSMILSTFKFTETTDLSKWKTYTNMHYGFGFKYPSDWVLEGESVESDYNRTGGLLIHKNYSTTTDNNLGGYCGINVGLIDGFYDSFIKENTKSGDAIEDVSVGGIKSTRIISKSSYITDSVYVKFMYSGVLAIDLRCGNDVVKNGQEIFKTFLNSFTYWVGDNKLSDTVCEKKTLAMKTFQFVNPCYKLLEYEGEYPDPQSFIFYKNLNTSPSDYILFVQKNTAEYNPVPGNPVTTYEKIGDKNSIVKTWESDYGHFFKRYYITDSVDGWEKCNKDLSNSISCGKIEFFSTSPESIKVSQEAVSSVIFK